MPNGQCIDYTRLVSHHPKLFKIGDVPVGIAAGMDTKYAGFAAAAGGLAGGAAAGVTFLFTPLWMLFAMIVGIAVCVIVYMRCAMSKTIDDPWADIRRAALGRVEQDALPPEDLHWVVIIKRTTASRITHHNLRTINRGYWPDPVGEADRILLERSYDGRGQHPWYALGRQYITSPVIEHFEEDDDE